MKKKTSLKVNDVVSVQLARYKDRKLGIIHNIIKKYPEGKGELMYGVPWAGPYPLIGVFIRSIVGPRGGEDGYYYFTKTDVDAGKVKLSEEKLLTPQNKFQVGDKVAHTSSRFALSPCKGKVVKVPTLMSVYYSVFWNGCDAPDDRVSEDMIAPIAQVKAEAARIKHACKRNQNKVASHMSNISTEVIRLMSLLKENNISLEHFLELNPRLNKNTKANIEVFANHFTEPY